MSKEEFVKRFQQEYSFIAVERDVIEKAYDKFYQECKEQGARDEAILDMVKDYILSQGLENEIVL